MALIRLFKVPKHRTYEYKPRYWNREQEELHERIRKAEAAKAQGVEGMRDRVRAGLRKSYTRDYSAMRMQTVRRNVRLLLVLGALIALTYYVLGQYLPRIIELIEGRSGM